MPTTTTNPLPDVPLPAGAVAVADDDACALWDNGCRMFRGPDRVVLNGAAEIIAEVRTTGMQLPDGSVDNAEDAPTIDICLSTPGDLTSGKARELAATLVAAADELDGWAR
jgi:hypothetical protein